MNWFTTDYVAQRSLEAKAKAIAEHGGCEHVEADNSLLHAIQYENDPWGREGYCVCEACQKKAEAKEDAEDHTCCDCKQSFTLASGGTLWKWWDFYAPQGDEPLPICATCRNKEPHLTRRRRDAADLETENEYQDNHS